jgi:hypothetical protein
VAIDEIQSLLIKNEKVQAVITDEAKEYDLDISLAMVNETDFNVKAECM